MFCYIWYDLVLFVCVISCIFVICVMVDLVVIFDIYVIRVRCVICVIVDIS